MSQSYNGEYTYLYSPPAVLPEVKAALENNGPAYVDYGVVPDITTPVKSGSMNSLWLWLGLGALLFFAMKGK